ncbi:MAG: response regulator [bacterium]|nr:response regulator [bacterium]
MTTSTKSDNQVDARSASSSVPGKHNILFVDDEPNILNALKRLFRTQSQYECHFADGPAAALALLIDTHVKVVVCDHRMPQMEGAEFLARLKKKRPDTVCIMLTGQANLKDVETAVNEGSLFKFVLKPWDDNELKSLVASALEKYEANKGKKNLATAVKETENKLQQENEELLKTNDERTEQLISALETAQQANSKLHCTLHEIAKAFCVVLELARPDIGVHSNRVAKTVNQLCEIANMSFQDRREAEIAALLHDIGQIGLPRYIIEKSRDCLNDNERLAYETHPAACYENLKSINGFDRIAAFIFAHHERYNGTGFPRKLKAGDISTQSYLIGIADEYDHLMQRVTSDPTLLFEQTYDAISNMSDTLFPRSVVDSMLAIMDRNRSEGLEEEVKEVSLNDLAPGDVLARNIYTVSGTMLLAVDTMLDHRKLLRLRSIDKVDAILGTMRIRKRETTNTHHCDSSS